ncbi:hypothetical protein K525DRAFT_147840, partial [Schizophyllum commune Loenen D]
MAMAPGPAKKSEAPPSPQIAKNPQPTSHSPQTPTSSSPVATRSPVASLNKPNAGPALPSTRKNSFGVASPQPWPAPSTAASAPKENKLAEDAAKRPGAPVPPM